MTDPVDLTLATYQANVQRYVDAGGPPSPALQAFLGQIAEAVPGGTVLEVGSGPGRDADHLESLGLRVDRTDATPAFTDRLLAAGHEARLLDVRTDRLGGPYDAVLAQAVLLHLSREQLDSFAGRALAAVRRGGVLAATLKEGVGGGWTSEKLGAPRFFTYWQAPELHDVLESAGWDVVSLTRVQGRFEPWLYVLTRRP